MRAAATTIRVLLVMVAALFFALHFVHLRADFPNFSPWMDYSKYTDEGWYGDAAIRHYERGRWYVAGDFNPAVALPVWPLLEAVLFRFTGVSLAGARALTVSVFGGILLTGYALLRRWARSPEALAPAASVALLAVSPFCFVFTRLAILEPLLILLGLLAMWTVSHARAMAQQELRGNLWVIVGTGVLLPAMVLTKTTGMFLMPAIGYLLWAAVGYRVRALVRIGTAAGGLGLGLWLIYFFAGVRPHYLLDYRYLFTANAYTGITWANARSVLSDTLMDGQWMGAGMYWVAVGCMVAVAAVAALRWRAAREVPLAVALTLWALGYAAFLAYHDNLQPRYYLVIAVALTLLAPLVVEDLLLPGRGAWAAGLAAVAMVAILAPAARQTLGYVRHPQYTFLTAAHEIRDYLAADARTDPGHNRLILSISGSDLSLMTGLPSICDDFGTAQLSDRVARYRPGWYAAWNDMEDDKMEALEPLYKVTRVTAFPAMDDVNRNVLILYKLEDTEAAAQRVQVNKAVPRRLRTRLGQQPSVDQLRH